jgi:signal transduction histidine kinase
VVRRENALAATMLADEATFPKLSDYLVFVHPDDRELLRQTLTSHVKGETALFECSYRTKARGEGWVWVSGKGRVVARDSNGWALRMVGTNRDITAIKRAEDALRELNEDLEVRVDRRTEALARSNRELQRALDELTRTQRQLVESEKLAALGGLVAGVAHEINTPLGVGVTAASHLQAEARSLEQRFALSQIGKAELKQFIDQATQSSDLILRNLDRASQLVRSFKQVAVDQSSEQRREFRLKSYLNEILVSLHPRIRKIDVKVRIECEDSITLDTYPGALYQIVVNLIINSLVHGFEGRQGNQIEIAARADGDKVVIDYRDNGKGMSEAVKRRVFEPFFTTKRGTGGSGLGMHIVYNLTTQLLGGEVSCESDEGKGVHVQLRVPMVARGRTDAA